MRWDTLPGSPVRSGRGVLSSLNFLHFAQFSWREFSVGLRYCPRDDQGRNFLYQLVLIIFSVFTVGVISQRILQTFAFVDVDEFVI